MEREKYLSASRTLGDGRRTFYYLVEIEISSSVQKPSLMLYEKY